MTLNNRNDATAAAHLKANETERIQYAIQGKDFWYIDECKPGLRYSTEPGSVLEIVPFDNMEYYA